MTTQSTSTSTSTAKAMAEAQRRADKAHHEKRVNWLMGTNPVYACGTRVAPSDVAQMLRQSREYLRNPAGSTMNHCQCEPRCA